MSVAIVDVREWQNILDLKTGKKIDVDTPAVQMIKGILQKHPYPGDTALESNSWVTDTALALQESYDPQFIFLSYAQQFFATRYIKTTEAERQAMYDAVFAEIARFTQESGFVPVVVGTGDIVPAAGFIDLSKLDGLAVCSHWATHYAGLYNLSDRDMEYVKNVEQIERIVSRKDFIEAFNGKPGDDERLPEYLVTAREGFCFRTPDLRRPLTIPACGYSIPVATPLGEVAAITDLGAHILDQLRHHKIALIIVEGIGIKDFRLPFNPCSNGVAWYFYEPGDAQYLAISQGVHQMFAYCPGYRYYQEASDDYPFSGYFNTIPENTIGKRFAGKSIAVGNRSMFMHTLTGTDIAIECFARNLNNQGCLAVIHREDK